MSDDVSPEPVEPAPVNHVTKGTRRGPLLVVLGLLLVGGLVPAVLVVRSTDDADPDEALAAARDAVADATSFRVVIRSTDVMVEGDAESGSETTSRTRSDAEWSDGVWHTRGEDQYYAYESITEADGTTYSRDSTESEETEIPPDAQWERWEGFGDLERSDLVEEMTAFGPGGEDDDGFAEQMAVGYAAMLYLAGEGAALDPTGMGPGFGPGLGGEPTAFLDAIAEMGEPTFEDSDTLTATLHAGDDLNEAFGQPLPDGRIDVDLGTDDLPTAVRLFVESGENSSAMELTFSDWNTPIDIPIPGDDEIDATPWVDEAAVEALPFAPVLPSSAPDGWEVTFAEVMAGTEYYGDEEYPDDCQLLEVDYDQPVAVDADEEAYEEADYVWLYQSTLACALAADPTPFAPGGPGGLPSRDGAFGSVQVLVGDTAVDVDATLQGAELDTVLASLAPVDVQAVVDTAAAMGDDWMG